MREAVPALLNVTLAADIEGDYLIGQATLFDSALAEKVQKGLAGGIFTHVCGTVWAAPGAPVGTGLVVQVSLVTGDFTSCHNARIVAFDEG